MMFLWSIKINEVLNERKESMSLLPRSMFSKFTMVYNKVYKKPKKTPILSSIIFSQIAEVVTG